MNHLKPLFAIFVARSEGLRLEYGMTGEVTDFTAASAAFRPHGRAGLTILTSRDRVYIPSLDKTRHCPSPARKA